MHPAVTVGRKIMCMPVTDRAVAMEITVYTALTPVLKLLTILGASDY